MAKAPAALRPDARSTLHAGGVVRGQVPSALGEVNSLPGTVAPPTLGSGVLEEGQGL